MFNFFFFDALNIESKNLVTLNDPKMENVVAAADERRNTVQNRQKNKQNVKKQTQEKYIQLKYYLLSVTKHSVYK